MTHSSKNQRLFAAHVSLIHCNLKNTYVCLEEREQVISCVLIHFLNACSSQAQGAEFNLGVSYSIQVLHVGGRHSAI